MMNRALAAVLAALLYCGSASAAPTIQPVDWQNPKDFGALVDGVTNDTGAWNALIATLALNIGGKALLSTGTSRANLNLGAASPNVQVIDIEGAGYFGSIIQPFSNNPAIATTLNTELRLHNIRFDTPIVNTSLLLNIASIFEADRTYANGNNVGANVLYIHDTNSVLVRGSRVANAGPNSRGILGGNLTAGRFIGNRVIANQGEGMILFGPLSVGSSISHTIFDSNGQFSLWGGLEFASETYQNTVSFSYFESNKNTQLKLCGDMQAAIGNTFHGGDPVNDVQVCDTLNVAMANLGGSKPWLVSGASHVLIGNIMSSLSDTSANSTVFGNYNTVGLPIANHIPADTTFHGSVYLMVNGTPRAVEYGAPDSCGTGYRCLRVQN